MAKIKKPAFVDNGYEGEYVFVTRDTLISIIDDSEQFIKWVIKEIEARRPR